MIACQYVFFANYASVLPRLHRAEQSLNVGQLGEFFQRLIPESGKPMAG